MREWGNADFQTVQKCICLDVISVGPVGVIQNGYQEDPLPNAAIETLITDENIEETLQVEILSTKKFLRLFWFLILSD